MNKHGCQSQDAYRGMHEFRVEGTPRSRMTWFVCNLCGKREPRGTGLFYKPEETEPTNNGVEMNNEWKALPTFVSVAEALNAGEEIWLRDDTHISWGLWDGGDWRRAWKFRSRPAQPKTKKVKVLGWMSMAGQIVRYAEGVAMAPGYKRAPSEDREIEVME